MTNRKAALRQYLTDRHQTLTVVLNRLAADPTLWRQPVYHDGEAGWTVGQLLGHLASAGPSMLNLARQWHIGENPVPEDFDIDRWNQSRVRKSAEIPIETHIAALHTGINDWLTLLDELSDADLDRSGRHGLGDTITIAQLYHRFADHEAQHAADIAAALEGVA